MKTNLNQSLSFLIGIALIALPLTGCAGENTDRDNDEHTEQHDGGKEEPDDHEDDEDGEDHEGEVDTHEEHPEGEPIELSGEQASAAGIRLFEVGPGLVERRLVLPAVVEPDTNAVSHVTPKISGVASEVHMGLGQRVKRGDLMCVIDSVELGGVVADYRRARALAASAVETHGRERDLFEGRLVASAESFDGQIEVRTKTLNREKELREQQVSTVRPLLDAERELRESELAKTLGLTELEAERDTRLLELETLVKERTIEEESALAKLNALGIRGAELEAMLIGDGALNGKYSIRAQRDGVVIKRLLSVGQYVEVGTELFEILDLSRVWIVASAFEDVVRLVKGGQQAEVRLHAFPDLMIPGEVVLIHYSVDPESRSLALRIELDNHGIEAWGEDFPLRPGMFGDVSLVIESHEVPLAIPEEALVHDSGIDAVFVQTSEGHFEKRMVETIGGDGELVEVRPVLGAGEPLRVGDKIAVGGTFTLKSMDQADQMVGHEH